MKLAAIFVATAQSLAINEMMQMVKNGIEEMAPPTIDDLTNFMKCSKLGFLATFK